MGEKGILHNMTGWSQFFFFCFISFASIILGTIVVVFTVGSTWETASSIRMAQLIQTIFIFLLPAILFAYLCQDNPKSFLKIDTSSTTQLVLLVIVLLIVIQPFIYLLSYYNQQLVLPESMAGIERWIKESEEFAEKSLGVFLSDKSPMGIISNLLIIAVITGLAEELFFRGCLQQIMQKIVLNKHVAIWITAIIFSTIHFQFYGFVPRMLLGALLGYLFVWSGSLWLPIIAHTLHNAINVILLQIYYGTPQYEEMENLNIDNHIWLAVLSFVLSFILLYFIHRNRISMQRS